MERKYLRIMTRFAVRSRQPTFAPLTPSDLLRLHLSEKSLADFFLFLQLTLGVKSVEHRQTESPSL